MLDIRLIREDKDRVAKGLKAKKVDVDLKAILNLDEQRREVLTKADTLRAEQNKASDEIAVLIKNKKDAGMWFIPCLQVLR